MSPLHGNNRIGTFAEASEESFARLMSFALYGENGYYTTRVQIGEAGGDFYTAAQSGLFAWTLANYIEAKWLSFGSPSDLQVVEYGGGQGELAVNLLVALANRLQEVSIAYRIRELSPGLQHKQQATVSAISSQDAQALHSAIDPALPTIIVANELLDAFPVERVRRTKHGWQQAYIRRAQQRLELVWKTAATDVAVLADKFVDCPVGTEAEICMTYDAFLHEAFELAKSACLLLIDYGVTKAEWQSGVRPQGTLRAYRQHQLVDVMDTLGTADITADVNWDLLMHAAVQQGWTMPAICSQGMFLMEHGIVDCLQALAVRQPESTRRRLTNTLKQLVLPGGFGERFSVFQCQKTGRDEHSC